MNSSQGWPVPALARLATRTVRHSSRFKGDLKSAVTHRKVSISELKKVMSMIANRSKLDEKYLDHPLNGRYPKPKGYTDCRECHVCNDWLLVYLFPDDNNVHFIATGTRTARPSTRPAYPSYPARSPYAAVHINKPGGFPAGKYKVDISLSGESVASKDFEVK